MDAKRPLIAPSILSADFWNLGKDIRDAEEAGIQWLHIDVMDGHFVPNITIGPLVVRAISKYTSLMKDVHLMIEKPLDYIDEFSEAGADLITIHFESSGDIPGTIRRIRDNHRKVGISVNPDTPVSAIYRYLPDVDLVLVMSVHPGFGGQKFIPRSIEKIRELKREIARTRSDAMIEVDGGINKTTIKDACLAGADILVAGSAVFNEGSTVKKNIAVLEREIPIQ